MTLMGPSVRWMGSRIGESGEPLRKSGAGIQLIRVGTAGGLRVSGGWRAPRLDGEPRRRKGRSYASLRACHPSDDDGPGASPAFMPRKGASMARTAAPMPRKGASGEDGRAHAEEGRVDGEDGRAGAEKGPARGRGGVTSAASRGTRHRGSRSLRIVALRRGGKQRSGHRGAGARERDAGEPRAVVVDLREPPGRQRETRPPRSNDGSRDDCAVTVASRSERKAAP